MRCHDAIVFLSRYRDGDLDSARRAQVEQHLGACPRCRDQFAAVEAALACLHQLHPEPAPPGLTDAVRARLRSADLGSASRRPRAVLLRWALPVAGAALLVVVGFGIMHTLPRHEAPSVAPVALRQVPAEEGVTEMRVPADERAAEAEQPAAVPSPTEPPAATPLAPPPPAEPRDAPPLAAPHLPAPRAAVEAPLTERTREADASTVREMRLAAPRRPPSAAEVAEEAPSTAISARPRDETMPFVASDARAAPDAFVNVTARATPTQVAGNTLTLEIQAEGEVGEAEVALQANQSPEVLLWRGRLEKSKASNLDVQLQEPSARQQLIVRGPQGAAAYNVYAPPAPEVGLRGAAARVPAPQTWEGVLQQMAAQQRVYVLAPKDFPTDRPAGLGPSPAPKRVEEALQGMGYQLRAETGVINIERAPAPEVEIRGRGRAQPARPRR